MKHENDFNSQKNEMTCPTSGAGGDQSTDMSTWSIQQTPFEPKCQYLGTRWD